MKSPGERTGFLCCLLRKSSYFELLLHLLRCAKRCEQGGWPTGEKGALGARADFACLSISIADAFAATSFCRGCGNLPEDGNCHRFRFWRDGACPSLVGNVPFEEKRLSQHANSFSPLYCRDYVTRRCLSSLPWYCCDGQNR